MRVLGWAAIAAVACTGDDGKSDHKQPQHTGTTTAPQCLADGTWDMVSTLADGSDALCSSSSTVSDQSFDGTLQVPCSSGCTCTDDLAQDCTLTLSQTCNVGVNQVQTDCTYSLTDASITGTCTKQQTGASSITCNYDVVGTPTGQ